MTQYATLSMQDKRAEADSFWRVATEIRAEPSSSLARKTYFPDPFSEPDPKFGKEEALIEVIQTSVGGNILYAFYIFLSDKRRPRLNLYVHRVDSAWERRTQNVFDILHSPEAQLTAVAYRLLWGLIDSLLPQSVKGVYFSPDGIYYHINAGALYNGKKFIADRYGIWYLASSRRLVLKERHFPAQLPVVIGNPDFNHSPISTRGATTRGYRLFQGKLPPLPGAEEEAKAVAALLQVEPLISKAATKDKPKQLHSPEVLYIATHGYFQEGKSSPLLRAGPLLAEAAVWDSLNPPLGIENGYLTPQEVSSMNLLGTRLVALSACETGLGDITRKGLYSLQRTFLEAGANE